jgi:TonB family protein
VRLITLIIVLFINLYSVAQSSNTSAANDEIYTIVEQQAEFPGGIQAMMKYIQSNIKYPAKMRDLGVGGKVFLKFVVDLDGSISEVSVLKGTGSKLLDDEAVRVVLSMPLWSPARLSGRPVKCYYNLPISYAISTPFMIFNANNTNENYNLARKAIEEKGNYDQAIEYYQKIPGDVDSWFNLGVIYWQKGDKRTSRKYFEDVRSNVKEQSSQLYVLSERFLTNNF